MREEGLLVLSTNPGRYALNSRLGMEGHDISSGTALEVFLGGRWWPGTVEHATNIYAVDEYKRGVNGYYFISAGGITGLCVGMRVRADV
jgi:hypothetical protein